MLLALLAQAPLTAVPAPPAADPAFAAAVAARTAGRTDEAIAAFEVLSRTRPADPDVWLNLGLAYSNARRYADAERALRTCLGLAPTYADARLAYARLAFFQGDRNEAQLRLAPVLSGPSARNPDVVAFARQLREADPRPDPWRLDLAYSRSTLSAGLPDWTSLLVSLSRRLDPDVTVVGSIERTERFGVVDTYVEGLAYRRWGDTGGYLALGGAPDADYRPEIALRGGLDRVVSSGEGGVVTLGADAAWSRYAVGEVKSLQPWVRWERGAVALTARAIGVIDEFDETQTGYALRGEVQASERLRLSAGWSDAPESADGRTVAVKASSIGLVLDLTPRLALNAGATHEDRAAYDRNEWTLGFTRRF